MILTTDIELAVEVLNGEGVIMVPTETVYGLAGDANSSKAVKTIFALKRRPLEVMLPVMVKDLDTALSFMDDERVKAQLKVLGEAFWPGPLTVVVAKAENAPLEAFKGQQTIGFRCPDHPQLLSLLSVFGPLAVTSANLHGQKPIQKPEEGEGIFPDDILCIDGGRCHGQPSTVVSLAGDEVEIMRAGPISLDQIMNVLINK
ncbi:MAG: L-threonylcarbamoyladenylate synthase [Firmicutes bacterium]|nr:L-threonylcarbamoyladenylate synthase [Bacillota bacterium]